MASDVATYFGTAVIQGPTSLPSAAGQMPSYDTDGTFTAWVSPTGDHGDLAGLSDDDHTQYLHLDGRVGGQTINAVGEQVRIAGNADDVDASMILAGQDRFAVSQGFAAIYNASTATGAAGGIRGVRSRGTLDAPAAVQNGDVLFSFLAAGYDGSVGYVHSNAIQFVVDAVVSANAVPVSIKFATATSGGSSRNDRLVIYSNGHIAINHQGLTRDTVPASTYIRGAHPASTVLQVRANPVSQDVGTKLQEWANVAGTVVSSVDLTGAFMPPSLADSAAANGSLYYSTDASKLVFKDSTGTVNALY